ncbi:DUF1826 domain-containing protein [Chryseobacterium salviniae]|uniref:DUF1826 domain-containing protein n=1 Tax=Chryseobacterium salviniae TaxID=3101750 RepID=A0ABU6HSI8_9FLAO|nr:DUF1826 domain-containing protein [Chryseobacterium sp. T9W2-O]MEC3875427.1 DUF1826 domain-containing protein [Chryseobacterium sp. T9W2-O]
MNTYPQHHHIGIVSSFAELVNTKFQGNINALCWERNPEGDFQEIVSKLTLKENITEISIDDLLALDLSEKGNAAREIIMQDIQLLADFGAAPSLNLLKKYERDDDFDIIPTDVYSFHADRSPIETSTFLCTYYGAASELIPNDQCTQKILIPEIRDALRKLHDGPNEEFETFLKDNYFDLHYAANADAKPVNLGKGNLWRLAVDHPAQSVLPCIHRAPKENEGECRLLLIC